MAIIRNTAGQGLYVYAHNTATDTPETGDAANITANISLDGGGVAPTIDANPTEIGGGVYWFDLDQTEVNAAALAVIPSSVTANVLLDPVMVFTQEIVLTGLPALVWAYGVRTLTSFGTLVADITAAISAILCNVWSCARRTLTMPITQVKSMLRGEHLNLLRGDTLDQDFIGLGDLTTATELWFTVKKELDDTDATAEIQISLTVGLEAIAGAAATVPANGSITITDLVAGNITVALAAVEMAKLDVDFVGYWDIQKAVGAVITTITRGNCQVLGDASRSTS